MPQLAQKFGYFTEIPKPVVRGIEVGTLLYCRNYFGSGPIQQAIIGGAVYAAYDTYVNQL